MTVSFKFQNAVNAPEFERRGNEWNPHVHWVVPTHDEIESGFVQKLLDEYSEHVEAFFITSVFDDQTLSVELQFRDDEIGERCHKEYMQGFGKGGVVALAKKAMQKKATKRLYKDRMYRLPDGEMFLYYALWDSHGNLVGKVAAANDRLENRIVHRSVLEQCECIPKGEEPWTIA